MDLAIRLLVMLSAAWAALALLAQVVRARGGGRPVHGRPAGSPARGLLYIFTVAMTPAHKESVGRHPVKFAVGVLLHLGVVLAFLGVALLVAWPESGTRVLGLVRPVTGAALLAGLVLLVQRALSPTLRAMSAPDDYLAALATCGLLALASAPLPSGGETALLVYTCLLLLYLPLGKLRHAVFFFVARGDYGRRLGFRGVYPPAATGTE